ncbi:MAG: hypothetical protein WC551_08730 [Patescibacteria group bacterium]
MKTQHSIDFPTPLTAKEINNFREAGWFLVRHAFLPALGSGKPERDSAKPNHRYTFEN